MEAFQSCALKAGYSYTQSTHFNLSQVYIAIFRLSEKRQSSTSNLQTFSIHKLHYNKTKTKTLSITIFLYWQGHTNEAHEKQENILQYNKVEVLHSRGYFPLAIAVSMRQWFVLLGLKGTFVSKMSGFFLKHLNTKYMLYT